MKSKTKPERRQKKQAEAEPKEKPFLQTDEPRGEDRPFPIVGIGASAGRLEMQNE